MDRKILRAISVIFLQGDMNTILLTGANGFIGFHTAQWLVSKGIHVLAPVRNHRAINLEGASGKRLRMVRGLFYDTDLLAELFQNNHIDAIIHLAAVRGGGRGGKEHYWKVNVEGTEHLLKTALQARVKRFVYCSSVGVWGSAPASLPPGPLTPLCGDSLYHQSKIQAESAVLAYAGQGLSTVIIRPAIAYGPGDRGFPNRLVDLVYKRMLPLPLPDTHIHLISVVKLADVFFKALTRGVPGKAYTAADRSPVGLKSLVDLIHTYFYGRPYPGLLAVPRIAFRVGALLSQALGREDWFTRMELLGKSWYYDISDTQKELGYEARETTSAFPQFLEEEYPLV